MKRYSSWRTILLWLVVIAAMAFFMHPRRAVDMDGNDDSLTLSSASGYEVTIRYDRVESVELRDSFDFGMLIDGIDAKKEKSGAWRNDEFGDYRLCVDARISSVIVLTGDDSVMVVNYGSEKSTESLYDALLRRLGQAYPYSMIRLLP